jgi:hypothetical protein
MREALFRDEYRADGWVYLVLTLDRHGYYGGKRWECTTEAYRALSRMSRNFLARLRRRYASLGSAWVATVEKHRDGWPHDNLVLYCPELADELRAEQDERLADPEVRDAVELSRQLWRERKPIPAEIREKARRVRLIGGHVLEHAEAVGWGRQSTAEAARDRESLIGYLLKLIGEASKISQAPTNAPVKFRRLRSGKGFLPPRHKSRYTGVLLRRRPSREGDEEICKVNPPQDPAQNEAVQAAISAEWQLIREEQDLLSQNAGELPPMPPTRYASVSGLEPLGHVPPEDPFDSS